MPVKYPLLKTKEFLKEQLGGKDPEQALTEYAKLRGEFFDETTGQFKKDMPQEKRAQFLKLKPGSSLPRERMEQREPSCANGLKLMC